MKSSPAEKAGLEAGDVVTAIDGKGITKVAEAMRRTVMSTIAQEMRFKVRRGGQTNTVVLNPSEHPSGTPIPWPL